MKKRYLLIPVAAAAVYTAWVFGSRHSLDQRWRASRPASRPADNPEFDGVYGGSGEAFEWRSIPRDLPPRHAWSPVGWRADHVGVIPTT